jgi:outer membrane murein-binding lipoprotein Lpp
MKTKQDEVSSTLQELEGKLVDLASNFEAAEQRVEEITNLNEN